MSEAEKGIWSDDLLDRKREAEFVRLFLINRAKERANSSRNKSYVLNLDGQWGQGKTFFLEHLHKQLIQESFLSVYINAWKDDHADDPMIAVMAAIDKALTEHLSKRPLLRKAWDVARRQGVRIAITGASHGAKKLAEKVIGDGAQVIAGIIKEDLPSAAKESFDETKIAGKLESAVEKLVDQRAEKALKKFNDDRISIDNFRENLAKFISQFDAETELKSPLFILIDELDRCRPPYAISTLERIKHFFDVKGVVFLIATDSSQLKHSIKAVYGEGFDSSKYLMRFFDRTYRFLPPTKERFVAYLFESNSFNKSVGQSHIVSIEKLFLACIDGFNLSLRDVEQCFDQLRTIHTTWSSAEKVQLIYIIPLIILFQQGETETYEALRNGNISPSLKLRLSMGEPLLKRTVRDARGDYREEVVRPITVLEYFMSTASQTFREIHEKNARTEWQMQINSFFEEEFRTKYASLTTNLNNKSSVLESWKSVESSGQFNYESSDIL